MKSTLMGLTLVLLVTSTWAGTFRDDFEIEKNFLEDKQFRNGGVWGEDINLFTWKKGSIKCLNATPGKFFALMTGEDDWEDYTVECRVKAVNINDDRSGFGLVLRRECIACPPGYFFVLMKQWAVIFNGPWGVVLKQTPFKTEIDTWYSLKAVAQGKQLEFYIDDKLVASAEAASRPSGKVGMLVGNVGRQTDVLFDDFVVTGPQVKDGGHWNPEEHAEEEQAVDAKGKLATTWAGIKAKR